MPALDPGAETAHRRFLVVDANSIIRRSLRHEMADEFYVVPDMLAEIRDASAREYLASLPFALVERSPSQAAMQEVISFARKTGDLAALSIVDIKVLALTYMLQAETPVGVAGLKTSPRTLSSNVKSVQVKKSKSKSNSKSKPSTEKLQSEQGKENNEDEDDEGWTVQRKKTSKKSRHVDPEGDWITPDNFEYFESTDGIQASAKHKAKHPELFVTFDDDGEEDGEEGTAGKEVLDDSNYTRPASSELPTRCSTPSSLDPIAEVDEEVVLREIETLTINDDEPVDDTTECLVQNVDGAETAPKKKKKKKRGGKRVNRAAKRLAQAEAVTAAAVAAVTASTSSDNATEGVEPAPQVPSSGVSFVGIAREAKDVEAVPAVKQQEITVSCITADFAMQNVLLQMGLRLIGTDGQRVKSIKSWLLRCHGCSCISLDTSRQFCPDCGNPSMIKTSYSVNSQGETKLYLKENFKYITRGNRYAIPTPKGGREGNELILTEDQKEYHRAQQTQRRLLKAASAEKDFGFFESFSSEKGGSKSQHVTATGKILIGKGGRNVNAARKKRR